jgi:hypothetical protein
MVKYDDLKIMNLGDGIMKITTYLSILICCLFITLLGCSKYPSTYPKLKISGDNIQFEGTVNGASWINGEGGSSSDLGDWHIERAKDVKPVSVKGGSVLSLNLTYIKDLQYFKVFKVEGTDKNNQKLTDIKIEDFKLHVPIDKGNHIYAVETNWDDKHGVGYVFKINID